MASSDHPFIMHGSLADGLLDPEARWKARAECAEAYKAFFRSVLAEIAEGVERPQEAARAALQDARNLVEGP